MLCLANVLSGLSKYAQMCAAFALRQFVLILPIVYWNTDSRRPSGVFSCQTMPIWLVTSSDGAPDRTRRFGKRISRTDIDARRKP